MNTHLILKRTIIGLVAGTIGHSTFASGDQLSSLVDDGSYTPAQRAAMIFGTGERGVQSSAEEKATSVSERTSTPASGSIAENIRLGVMSDVKVSKGLTQSYKKDVYATDTVEQGNISGSAFGGSVTQKFTGTVDAKKVEQGNISGTTIDGDIDQEF